jgi:hypothetical protein
MPTIAFKSRIRTVSDNCTLDVIVSHRLVAGEPSAAPRVVKNLPAKDLDIVLVSPLTITTTGMLNNKRISAEGLMTSRIAQHLLEYLKLVGRPSTCQHQLTLSQEFQRAWVRSYLRCTHCERYWPFDLYWFSLSQLSCGLLMLSYSLLHRISAELAIGSSIASFTTIGL